jgi:hypothetical protein
MRGKGNRITLIGKWISSRRFVLRATFVKFKQNTGAIAAAGPARGKSGRTILVLTGYRDYTPCGYVLPNRPALSMVLLEPERGRNRSQTN